jgi:hypothetical protein
MDGKQAETKEEDELRARLARLEQEVVAQRTRRYELELELEVIRRHAVVPQLKNDVKPPLRRLMRRRGSE